MSVRLFDRMDPKRLGELIERFSRARIAVVGDYFLDKYLDVDPQLAGVSIETGKTAHQVTRVRHSPGAAGTVVCNLAALGAGRIWAVGFTGDDGEAYDLRRDLGAVGCELTHLHTDPQRNTPTYLKPRDLHDASLAGEHARYDTKNRTPTSAATQERILASIDALLPEIDALIVLDQVEEAECGVVATAVRRRLAERASEHRRVVFWADSRRRIRLFRQIVIKANQFEAVGRDNPQPGDEVALAEIERALPALREATGAPVFVTRGGEGIVVANTETAFVPGVRVPPPIDTTGAGDSVTAGAVLALAAGAAAAEAALVGNLVASITIQQLATTGTARPDELPPRLALWQSQRVKY